MSAAASAHVFRTGHLARSLLRSVAALAVASAAASASAQYPNRPITMVVPFQAGATSDAIARVIAAGAAPELGQNIVVENRAGAEGMIGSGEVSRAQPDGYRILFASAGGLVGAPALRRSPPYDATKDFTPIAGVADFSFFLFVHPSVPAKSVNEFIAYVKANPGKLNYATANNVGLMSTGYLMRTAGLDMVRVSYKGEPDALLDLVGNRVQVMFASSTGVPQARNGQLRVLATTLTKRSPLMPDVPTMKETGNVDVPFGGGWVAIFGPPNMPRNVVDRLSKALIAANNRPETHARMAQVGLVPAPFGPDELGAFTKAQAALYRDSVRQMNLWVD